MKILIDNGHGSNTPGKCSPDKKHREYLWAREFAEQLVAALQTKGFDARRITPETYDVSLRERCRRVNTICKQYGKKNVLCISIHNNAAGSDGKWHTARGFSAHVSLNASERSKSLATFITKAVEAEGITIRKPLPQQYYWPQNLAICRDTNCAAVLTENLFQDNHEDVAFLASADGRKRLCDAHVQGIINYINAL